jgi:hypothetical protein
VNKKIEPAARLTGQGAKHQLGFVVGTKPMLPKRSALKVQLAYVWMSGIGPFLPSAGPAATAAIGG